MAQRIQSNHPDHDYLVEQLNRALADHDQRIAAAQAAAQAAQTTATQAQTTATAAQNAAS